MLYYNIGLYDIIDDLTTEIIISAVAYLARLAHIRS